MCESEWGKKRSLPRALFALCVCVYVRMCVCVCVCVYFHVYAHVIKSAFMCGKKESFQPFSFLSLFLCPPRTQFSEPASEGLASARSNPPEETEERSQCFSPSSELCLFPPLSECYYKSCSHTHTHTHTRAHIFPHLSIQCVSVYLI